jgi:hypothetical protein
MADKSAKRIKTESVTVLIPNASAFGNVVEPVNAYTPDKTYRYIRGVWGKVLNLANQTYIDLQLRDGSGGIARDPSHSELWSSPGVRNKDMFFPMALPITGSIIKPGAIARGPANPNADIYVQFVFLLADDLEEIEL